MSQADGFNGTERARAVVTVGVAGLGYWGPNLLRVLMEMTDVEVTWICDLDSDRLTRFQRRYPSIRTTSNYDDLLADPDLNGILIATPVFTHFALASGSLLAGKHTFVEKPLAPSPALADQMLALAESNGVTLMCGHTFLYSPAVRHVKQLLDGGALGDVHFISSSRVNLGLHQRDISVIWDLGPHDFSILRYWLGVMPVSVRATGRDCIVRGITDVAFVNMTFASGLVANVELSWLSPSKLRRTTLVGNERMVIYEDGAPEAVRIFDHGVVYRDPETFGEYHLSYRTGDVHSPKLDAVEPLSIELAQFVDGMRTGALPSETLDIAHDVVLMLDAAERALRDGGASIAISPSLAA